jgi:hypothetical protein
MYQTESCVILLFRFFFFLQINSNFTMSTLNLGRLINYRIYHPQPWAPLITSLTYFLTHHRIISFTIQIGWSYIESPMKWGKKQKKKKQICLNLSWITGYEFNLVDKTLHYTCRGSEFEHQSSHLSTLT